MRNSILVLALFFIIGTIILARVKIQHIPAEA
jgi:hypothetical protein